MTRSFRTSYNLFFDFLKLEFGIIRHRLTNKKKLLRDFFRLVLVVSFLLFISISVTKFFSNPDMLVSLVDSAQVFGPFIIVGLIILEVVLAPLPGTFIMVVAGALFGTWLGALYSYLGNVIGSLLAFLLAKHFGRVFVEKIISKKLLAKYDGFFLDHHKLFLLFYALPIIPVDILSFVSGLSAMKLKKFLGIVMIGFIPNTLILAFLGNRLSGLGLVQMIFYTLLFLLVFVLLAWLFKLLVAKVNAKKTI